MVSEITTLNSVQKIPTVGINIRRTLSPFAFYTCPAGKKAVIKGSAVVDNTGAAVTVDLNAAGNSIAEWQFSGGGTDPNVPQDLALGTLFKFEIQLDAGETLDYSQNTGTNASINVNAMVQETPA